MPPAAIAIGGMAAAGGVAGAMGSKQSSSSGLNLADAGQEEMYALQQMQYGGQKGFTDLVNSGPDKTDYQAGMQSQRDFASLLQQYATSGPNQQQIGQANNVANNLFGAQQTALNQNFQDQTRDANRQAALMGRDMNDPILRAKLAQEQTRQQQMLDANKGAFAQNYALTNQLNLMGQRSNILSGLASQAMANRQALLGAGQSIVNSERNFRVQTAGHWGEQKSGGGFQGAVTGAIAGAGAGMGMMNGMNAMSNSGGFMGGGGGGGGMPFMSAAPAAPSMSGFNYSQPSGSFFGNPYNGGGSSGFNLGVMGQPQARTFSLGGSGL